MASHDTLRHSKTFEIRAGLDSIPFGTKSKISTNTICGEFLATDNTRRVHTVRCVENILAEYVTLQIVEKASKIAINEIEIIPTKEGKIILLMLLIA